MAFKKGLVPWNKGKKGYKVKRTVPAWNKGKKGSVKLNSGSFKKGLVPWNKGKKGVMPSPWNKGKKLDEKTKQKVSRSVKKFFKTKAGKIVLQKMSETQFRKNQIPHNKGKKMSDEARKNMSVSKQKFFKTKAGKIVLQKMSETQFRKGKRVSTQTEFKKGNVPKHKGKTDFHSDEAKAKIRKRRSEQVIPFEDTKPEKILQSLLKDLGIKFETHRMYIKRGLRIVGQPDIFIKPNICIYADGDYFHGNPKFYKPNDLMIGGKKTAKDTWKKDKEITAKNKKQGYTVLRFWEDDLYNSTEKCVQKIIETINQSKK